MALTAGLLSIVNVSPVAANLLATAASGGTGPYTYQWYKSTTAGFTPGGGNIISGATALTLADTGLVPGTTYYYKMVATDTGHSNDTIEYAQLLVLAPSSTLQPNQFAQTTVVGEVDLRLSIGSVSAQIDASQATALVAGSPVKVVDSSGGVPKVVGITAASDEVFGFINFDIKSVNFPAGAACEISQAGNFMWLYAVAPIARGAQVQADVSTPGQGLVKTITGSSGADIVGYAFDKAVSAGQLIRVRLTVPSFAKA